ncbi:MAG: nickel transporter permease [Eubacteriales bacterium]
MMQHTKWYHNKPLICYGLLALTVILVAVFAPILATHDPNSAVFQEALQAPSTDHWFGTDKMGRDLFSRVLYGARTSLSSTLLLVAIIFTVGGTLGMVAGYVSGITDTIIMRIADIMVSFPGMALAIAMAGIMGPSITNAIIAITMISWSKYARLSRSLVLKIKNEPYMAAAQVSGSSTIQILRRYVLPALLPTLVITAAADVGGMMLELAAFSFLGLGAQAGSIEWGYMLNEGRTYLVACPWLMLFPGLAIFITVSVFNLLGDALRQSLDITKPPKKRPTFRWRR